MDAVDESDDRARQAANAVCKKEQGGVGVDTPLEFALSRAINLLNQGATRTRQGQDKSTEAKSRLPIDAEVLSAEGH